jgi:hypothetical protein
VLAELAAIAAAPARLLTRSASLDPTYLLAEARGSDRDVTLDELTAARLVASEHGRGTPIEMACVVDAELNRATAAGKTLTRHAAPTGQYGRQEGVRPASTRLNPTLRHLTVARCVLRGQLRGVARGAHRFWNPLQQERSYRDFKAGKVDHPHSCSALGLLRAWSFDLRPCRKGRRCCDDGQPPVGNPGPNTEGWVGPIGGVDAMRLMLMKPMKVGDDHTRAFESARDLIVKGLPA